MTDISKKLFDRKTLVSEGGQVSQWNVRPFQIVSLLEMIKFNAPGFVNMMQQFEMISGVAYMSDKEMTEQEKQETNTSLSLIYLLCQQLGLEFSTDYLGRVIEAFEVNPSFALLAKEIPIVQRRIVDELKLPKFFYLPKDKATYYQNKELFSSLVAANFSKATEDIEAAGNCYATGNYTACVFHLMRVVEYGLRALAKRLKVSFKDKRGNAVPIDLQEWANIIDKIESEVVKLTALPKGRKKSETLKFYSVSAKEFRYFKDAWRNHVMHSRTVYDEHQAMSVMVHVRDFMQHLATKLKG